MIPNMAKLERLLNEKKQAAAASGGTKKSNLFIQSASLRLGDDGPVVDLAPDLVLPSSPAYYR